MSDQPAIDARLVELSPQQTAAVRVRRPMSTVDVGALMDDAMSRLGALFGQVGATPAGPPYARYHAWGGELADVEIGFPLAGTIDGLAALTDSPETEVGASELPGGRAAQMSTAARTRRSAMRTARCTTGSTPRAIDEGDGPWETYIDNPEEVADVAQLRTEITWPVPDR